MSVEDIMFVVLGAAAGGFINGLAGTGTALFAMGFYLVVLEPASAVAIISLMSVLTGLQGLWVVRTEIGNVRPRLLRFLLPGLIGVPIGVQLLSHVDADLLKLIVAGLLIFYGGFFGFRKALPRFDRRTPVADGAVGLVGGVLGGLASLSGALPAIWLSLRPWPKAQTRAVLQPYNMGILGLTVAALAWNGAYTPQTWAAFFVTLPVALISAQIGIQVYNRLSDIQFRRTLIILCLALGVGILVFSIG